MSKRKLSTHVKDSFLYTMGMYSFFLSVAATNIICLKILGPKIAGAITFVSAIEIYVALLYSPFRATLEREIPKLRSKKSDLAKEYLQGVFQLSYVAIFIGSIIFFSISLFYEEPVIKSALYYMVLLNLVKATTDLMRITHKAFLFIIKLSYTVLVFAILFPIVVIPSTTGFGLGGLYGGRILLYLVFSLVLILFVKSEYPIINLQLKWRVYKKIILIGAPIAAFGVLSSALLSIDKFIINRHFTLEYLGYYGVGAMVFQFLIIVPRSILGSYFPRFMTNEGDQKQKIYLLTEIIAIISVLIIIISFGIVGPAFTNYLPEYAESIPIAKIFILAIFYAGIYQIYYFDVIRNNKQNALIIYSIILILAFIAIYEVVVVFDHGLTSIALTTFTALFAYAVLVIVYSSLINGYAKRDIASLLLKIFLYSLSISPLLFSLFMASSHNNYTISYCYAAILSVGLLSLNIWLNGNIRQIIRVVYVH